MSGIHPVESSFRWQSSTSTSILLSRWTYTVAGGTDLIYSYKNAKSANNYGVELDIRKNLGFIGLKDFSWSFNGALIKSKVQFEKGSEGRRQTDAGSVAIPYQHRHLL